MFANNRVSTSCFCWGKPDRRFFQERPDNSNYYDSFVYEMAEEHHEQKGILAIDLGIKTLATGVNEQGRFYHIGGFKGHRWYNKHLDRISVEARSLQKRVAKV